MELPLLAGMIPLYVNTMNRGLKKILLILFTIILYVVALWALVILLLVLNQAPGGLSSLLFLAAASLVPVFLAEWLGCKRLGVHWLVVRLISPPLGGFLFAVTITIYNPMLWMNGLLLFFLAFFALCQSGLLLLSIICTVVYRKIQKRCGNGKAPCKRL